jgi:peptide/nickel transport system substrate-binding protein
LIAAAFAMLLSGCGDTSAAFDPNTLFIWLPSNPTTLNPVTSSDLYASYVEYRVFDALIELNSNMMPVPCVAKSWEWTRENVVVTNHVLSTNKEMEIKTNIQIKPVNMYVLTFHLRDDVYWHDGVKNTAHDFVYMFNQIMKPESLAQNKIPLFENLVLKVEAPDDYTFKAYYLRLHVPAIGNWEGIFPIPKHIYENEDFMSSPYNRAPVGNGEFYMKEWKQATSITLVKNTNYWREQIKFDRIVYRIISDDNAALAAFKKGLFDYKTMRPEEYENEKDKEYFKNGYYIQKTLLRNFWHITWNCKKGSLFEDKLVRQAMTCALDRYSLATNYFHNQMIVISGPFVYNSWAYDKSIAPLPYDLMKSKELLAKAGWTDSDGNGILDKDGREFRFEILLGQSLSGQAIVQNLKENLAKIGVIAEPRVLEWSAFDARLKEHSFDAASFAWSTDIDPDPFDLWHSSQIKNGINYCNYSNPELDKLIEMGRVELDQKKRAKIYHKVHQILAEDQPMTVLFDPIATTAYKKELKGVVVVQGLYLHEYYAGLLKWYKTEK